MNREYHNRQERSRNRTIPLKSGDADALNRTLIDAGKYYRCWNCGFICDIDRDQLAVVNGPNGADIVDYQVPSYPGMNTFTVFDDEFTVLKTESDGETVVDIRYDFEIGSGSIGCPNCRKLNWDGR